MKKLLIASLLFSSSSFAKQQIYIGANALIGNKTELEETKIFTTKATNDLGFNLYGGTNQVVYPFMDIGINVELGLELAYEYIADVDLPRNTTASFPTLPASVTSVTMDAHAFYVNARPKFSIPDANTYVALVGGIGYLDAGFTASNGTKQDENAAIYQIGVEAGYMIKNLDIIVGYRFRVADLDDAEAEVKGIIAGIAYRF